MASRRRRLNRIARRDPLPIASLRLVVRPLVRRPDRLLFDRRLHDPRARRFRTYPVSAYRRSERVRARDRSTLSPLTYHFAVPKHVQVCVRRKERREVLFASGRTKARGRKRRNVWSEVKCR